MKIKDFLENKNVLFYGDSITHNWYKYTHDYELVPGYDGKSMSGYVGYLKDNTSMKKIDNVAVSAGCYADASTFTDREEYRHFPYQIDHSIELLKNADVIFVFFGANDYSCQVPFGRYDESFSAKESHTFFSGMNYGFDKIKQLNPKAKVFVLTILNRSCPIDAKTYNYSVNEYNLAVKQTAKRYGFEIIDINSLFDLKKNYPGCEGPIFTDDGLHPNDKGSKIIADFILNHEIN